MAIHRGDPRSLEVLGGRRAVTLGTFDGVHRGHQAICGEAIRIGRGDGFDGSALVTFGRHPRAVLSPERRPRLLTTLEERIPLLAATGIDDIVVLDFDDELQHMEYDRFVREVLIDRLGMQHFVLGHDVHFGHERRGDYRTVAELADIEGFSVSQVASVRHDGAPISSTRIRDGLAAGRLDDAVEMMGHPFFVLGEVVSGKGVGRELGFATANLNLLDPAKHLPPPGVYAAWARPEGDARWRKAALNLGFSPTLGGDGELRLEVHLLDGSPDLYGERLSVAFGSHLRAERRFEDVDALRAQIAVDVDRAAAALDEARGVALPVRLDRLGPESPN